MGAALGPRLPLSAGKWEAECGFLCPVPADLTSGPQKGWLVHGGPWSLEHPPSAQEARLPVPVASDACGEVEGVCIELQACSYLGLRPQILRFVFGDLIFLVNGIMLPVLYTMIIRSFTQS